MPNRRADQHQLLLARTIYISLAYLGTDALSRAASDEYLDWIMRDERWDDLNRGFHLEYYGDIDFDPEAQMSHRDPMVPANEIAPCFQTVEHLLRRIDAHFENPEYGPLDIEVYTLYSLVQHRHSAANLDSALKNLALAEIPKLLSPRSRISKRLRPYLQMLDRNLKEDSFPVMNIGEHLYRLKSVIREGWLKRHLIRDRIESVSEHTHLCCLLALLYLPDWDGDGPEYRKDEVIKTLLIHDIAEAEIGDTAHPNVAEESRANERRVMQYLQMCGTYLRVADMSEVFALWNDFDGGLTETAKIAADIDKLETSSAISLRER